LFIDYLLHPHEYFVFAQKWYGKYTSIKGCEENDDVGTSVGRSTRGNGQEDRNDIEASDQLKSQKIGMYPTGLKSQRVVRRTMT